MNELKAEIIRKIGKKRLFYVCRDVERAAAGLLLNLPNFYIITNDGPYARELARVVKDSKIVRVKNREQLDTQALLTHCHSEEVKRPKNPLANEKGSFPASRRVRMTIERGDFVMVFKPTKQIEQICKQNGWKLLNHSAKLANTVEEKISQVRWLGTLKKYLPDYKICECGQIKWPGEKFVIQFNHSHTGSGTILVKSAKQLAKIQQQFPHRPARYARYISGPLFTNNNIVWDKKVLLGNISYQITGLKPFTDNKFATIGNDWAVTDKILNTRQIKQYLTIATAVGKRLARSGWKGLFGVDVIVDEKTGKLYLLEINARQPASTTYESELQRLVHSQQPIANSLTTFAAHLGALLRVRYGNEKLVDIRDGAQVILRKINNKQLTINKVILKNEFKVIEYSKPNIGADWLRIQSVNGMMTGHDRFNKVGKQINSLCFHKTLKKS